MPDYTLRSNVCHVDLTTGKVNVFDTPMEIVRAYLGGRGLNMFYLFQYLTPDTDPFSPDNPLIIGTGLLTGSGMPNSGRFSVSARSPETGFLGDSNIGGYFGPQLRQAGYDRLIITGKATCPSYIFIEDGRVEIRDAESYWGLNVRDYQIKLRADLGTDIEILGIGRSGEHRVRYAALINNIKNAAGRCGMGAVMGSKNLKCVVARGSGGVPIHHPENFTETVAEITRYLQTSKSIRVLGQQGTPMLYEISNYLGAIRTKNSQLNAWEDSLNGDQIEKHIEKMIACANCIVHCRHRNLAGGEGPEYTTVGLLGANVGIADPADVIRLNNLCNDLGLDTASSGSIIAWAIEAFEKGYITPEMTGGRTLEFGNVDLIAELLVDISERRSIGDLLAESTQAVAALGPETADFLIAIKGLPPSDPHDVRYIKSFALGIATASRGADHLRSRPTLDVWPLPKALSKAIYGVEIDPEPTSYETKHHLVYFHENIYAVIDSLGLCKFVCHGFNSPQLLKYSHFRRLIDLVTGLDFNDEELRQVGLRVVDLERMINLREGMTRAHDTLPKRYFDEEAKLKKAAGSKIDREKFAVMLTEYYHLRNWGDEGIPTAERQSELLSYFDYLTGEVANG
ncbi:MAG: aldehyde ferredoxin oxidoreductase family protein [bacterium]|nr:aldehyde ferredoxin oxidoreductase family protein [bacterium]